MLKYILVVCALITYPEILQASAFLLEGVCDELSHVTPRKTHSEPVFSKTPMQESLKILIIEDAKMCANILHRLTQKCLQDLNYTNPKFLFAETGKDALEIIDHEKPNIVFIDYNLEDEIKGVKIVEHIVQIQSEDSYTPIMIGCSNTESANQEMITAGAGAYITKPIYYTKLMEVLKNHLFRYFKRMGLE